MRKNLTIAGLFFIILVVSGGLVFPWLARSAVQTRLGRNLSTRDVQVNMDSTPSALMMLGRVDRLNAVLHQAKVGQICLKELTIDGRDIRLDIPGLIGGAGIPVQSAGSLTLKGIVDEEGLRDVIERKVDHVEHVQVHITREKVLVTADAKLAGRVADIAMEGQVAEENGALYFLMTRLDLKNTRLGTARLGDLFGNIQLAAPNKMPLGLNVRSVVQTDGAIIITADRDNKE